ncbi:hypothetical protein L3Q82_013924 [Scortum barcoo]|uniref:Uncharacterized protein n=1 Tax=Scortum barcoo TaxID=214431 RepID=A0ACB8VVB4_9TELE|nr:hypothetical protein L3Q82_013924 [Scortum barcoo]
MEKDRGEVLATERYGSAESWRYTGQDGVMERRRDGSAGESRGNSVVGVFKSVFLPQGYPESVSGDYLQYQFWDTVQAFSSSLSGTLATQASLKGVGVGNQEATVAAATVTWLLRGDRLKCNQKIIFFSSVVSGCMVSLTYKLMSSPPADGTGMLGRILFAWRKGSKLDSEAKKWRLFADVLNDIAMFMEILAPYFPAFFTLIVCTAGIFKSIVGVAGGATRAALTVHQARRDNMADISAKDGSQETLVNLAGLLVSLVLIPLVTDNPVLTLSLFFLFTVLHLFANYKAVRSVVMETFNEARLSIVLQQYLSDRRILSPLEANQREPVFLECRKTVPIKLGVRLQEVVQSLEELDLALKKNNMPYLLGVRNVLSLESQTSEHSLCCFQPSSVKASQTGPAQSQTATLATGKQSFQDKEHSPTEEEPAGDKDPKKSNDKWRIIVDEGLMKIESFPHFFHGDYCVPRVNDMIYYVITNQCFDNLIICLFVDIQWAPDDNVSTECADPENTIEVKEPWEWLGLDVRGPLPETLNGHKYILTVTDFYSKWVEAAVPMQSCLPPVARGEAHRGHHRALWIPAQNPLQAASRHSPQSECGYRINRELKDQLKVTIALVVYHHQTGTIDLITQQLIDRMVSDLIEEHAGDWDVYLPAKVFSLCFKEHLKTKERPFSVLCCKGLEPVQSPRGLDDVFLMIRRHKTTIFTDAKESTTVYELKRIVEGILKRPPEDQRLYKDDVMLNDSQTLGNCGFTNQTARPQAPATVGLAFRLSDDSFEQLRIEFFSTPPELPDVMKPQDSGSTANEQAVQPCTHRPALSAAHMDVNEHVLSAGRAVLDVVEREWQPLSAGELEQRLDQAVEEILEAELMARLRTQPPPAPPAPPAAVYVQLLQDQAGVHSQVLQRTTARPPEEEDEEEEEGETAEGRGPPAAAVEHIADLLQSSKSRVRLAGRARLSLSHTVLLSLTLLSERVSYRSVSRRFHLEKGNIHRIFFSFCERVNMLEETLIRWPVGKEAVDALFPLSSPEKQQQGVPQVLGVLGHTRIPIRLPIGKHDVESAVPEVKRMRKEAHPDSWLNLQLVCDRKGRFLHCRISKGSDVDRGGALRDKLRRHPELMPPGSCLVGPAGSPLTAQILTPYSGSCGPREELFNKTLEEHLLILDQAVANLRTRFQRLRYLDIGNYERARAVVLTACVLHNVFLDMGQVVQGEVEKEETTTREGEGEGEGGEEEDEGVRRRDTISDLLFKNLDSGSS